MDTLSRISVFLNDELLRWCQTVSRYILPVLAAIILYRLARSLLSERYEHETWAYLALPDGTKVPLRHVECVVGRARSSDIIVNYPTISRNHAALIRDGEGNWRVYDLASKGGVFVNSDAVTPEGAEIKDGDLLELAGVPLGFLSLTDGERLAFSSVRTAPGRRVHPGATFFVLTVFETLLALIHSINAEPEYVSVVTIGFGCLIAAQWMYYIIMRSIHRLGFETETLAFFLSCLGFSVCASSAPELMTKQVALLLAGLFAYILLGWWLRELQRAIRLRWHAAAAALGMLALNLILAQEILGARNWISIGGFSLQPSEFVKVFYIYAGAATLERLYTGRNLYLFIAFSAICVGALALMGDFGSALVFFGSFLIIAYMRSGNLATVFLAVSGASLAGVLMLTIKPHIAQRFATWGHVWEYANDAGFQQTRALSAAASGGLFGNGAGNGWLHQIVASDTDLVFCILCEELGLLVALMAVFAPLLLAAAVVRFAAIGRSAYYVIAASAAVSIFMLQLALNVFGSLDILPFTGVTFPFVSRGGSSLISCWIMLAFIKALDTRRNSSFTTSLLTPRKIRRREKARERREYEERLTRYDEQPDGENDDDIGDLEEYDNGISDVDYDIFFDGNYDGVYDAYDENDTEGYLP